MKPAKKKKPTRRSKVKYPNLVLRFNSRIRQEKLDFDYLDQLSPSELSWLNKFVGEEVGGSFKKDGTDLNKTDEDRKRCYTANNKANNDLFGILRNKADKRNNKKLIAIDNMTQESKDNLLGSSTVNVEDAYIEYLEHKEIVAMMKEYEDAMANWPSEKA